jgi:hypothetical protein
VPAVLKAILMRTKSLSECDVLHELCQFVTVVALAEHERE